jgi:hypothetical protein
MLSDHHTMKAFFECMYTDSLLPDINFFKLRTLSVLNLQKKGLIHQVSNLQLLNLRHGV